MKDLTFQERGALQGRMIDVQENLLELYSAAAMDGGSFGWEDIRIERPEDTAPAEKPALKLVA